MLNKKGDDTFFMTLGVIILVLFFIFFQGKTLLANFSRLTSTIDQVLEEDIPPTLKRCEGQKGTDYDKDGLPDYCDNCPLVHNTNVQDTDNGGKGDGFPLGCCGNDGEWSFLIDPDGKLEEENYKKVGWCKDKAEKDTETEKPKHPVYAQWS